MNLGFDSAWIFWDYLKPISALNNIEQTTFCRKTAWMQPKRCATMSQHQIYFHCIQCGENDKQLSWYPIFVKFTLKCWPILTLKCFCRAKLNKPILWYLEIFWVFSSLSFHFFCSMSTATHSKLNYLCSLNKVRLNIWVFI